MRCACAGACAGRAWRASSGDRAGRSWRRATRSFLLLTLVGALQRTLHAPPLQACMHAPSVCGCICLPPPKPKLSRLFCTFLGLGACIVGENVQSGLHCGGKWGKFAAASRGGGAPPTPPPRLDQLDWSLPGGFPRHLRPHARREEPAHRSGPLSRRAVGGRGARDAGGPQAVRRRVAPAGLRALHRALTCRAAAAVLAADGARALLLRKLP